jgi:tellurite resistance protein
MGLFSSLLGGIVESIGNEIIASAFDDALSEMQGMCANEGQLSVFENTVVAEFENSLSSSSTESGWDNVDIGEYMDFMGEIVEAGNSIMSSAYEYLASASGSGGSDGEFDEDEAADMGSDYEGDS